MKILLGGFEKPGILADIASRLVPTYLSVMQKMSNAREKIKPQHSLFEDFIFSIRQIAGKITVLQNLLLFTGSLLLLSMIGFAAQAQERTTDRVWASPNAAVTQTIGLTEIHLTYGRPSVRDRVIFGDLVPFGEVWRTGANESTAIVFSDDVILAGEPVPAGTYSIYTIPGMDSWTVILNQKLSWGTQYDEREDFLRVQAVPEEAQHMEQMMIYFENITDTSGEMIIHWADVKVIVPIEVTDHTDM